MNEVSNEVQAGPFFAPQTIIKHTGDWQARLIDVGSVAVAVALLALIATGSAGLPRVLLAFAFTVYVPGWAVVANSMPKLPSCRTALPVIISLVLLTAAATITLWLHVWHPLALFDIEAVASIALIAVAAIRRERRLQDGKPRHQDVVPGEDQWA